MARLHLQRRALIGPLVVLLGLASAALSCSDDLIDVPEPIPGEPACAWVIDSSVHFADGGQRVIADEATNMTGAGCLCLTEQEFESGSRHQELNDLALQVCNELVKQYDYEWSECQMDYESERWLDFVFWAVDDFEHPAAEALNCAGEP